MDRVAQRLTALAAAGLLLAGCSSTTQGSPVVDPAAPPPVSGYSKPVGGTVELADDDTTSRKLHVGDLVVAPLLRTIRQDPDPAVLAPAEVREGRLVYQAVGTGETRLYTSEIPDVDCDDGPCAVPPTTVNIRVD